MQVSRQENSRDETTALSNWESRQGKVPKIWYTAGLQERYKSKGRGSDFLSNSIVMVIYFFSKATTIAHLLASSSARRLLKASPASSY